ncbi:MAG TPA: NAD(P)H-dependent oxidoreductase subunit E [Acidimicrobiales bacterium]|nr:NAD(P)H-dependent oxidoreductase subunit E [Acidimicrobiales bacterium]
MARLSADNLARARQTISLYPHPRSALVPLCHLAQEQDGWLTPEAVGHIAELLDLTPAEVLGTASFYDMLHTEPVGRHLVAVCTNIACLLAGAEELLEHAEASLGVTVGGTTADGTITLEDSECIAYCDRAPCVQVNYRYFGPLDGPAFDRLVADLRSGALADTVPAHGVLNRVRRDGGLRVGTDEIAAQRARSDAERAERAEQARRDAGAAQGPAQGQQGQSGGRG